MKTGFDIFAVLLLVSLFLGSCRKQAPPCMGNCESIRATGRVTDGVTQAPVANIPVYLAWTRFVGLASKTEEISRTNTRQDGSYDFTSDIDTSYFSNGYSLMVKVDRSNDHMILFPEESYAFIQRRFDTTGLRNRDLHVYRKADLTIKLNKTETTLYTAFKVEHTSVPNTGSYYAYSLLTPSEISSPATRENKVATVADVYTKITIVKQFANGTRVITTDSLICRANAANMYTVSY